MSDSYEVQAAGNAVRAWSIQRLPFEPTGWLKEYREELRQGIRAMRPEEGRHLRAVYASPDHKFADVENVLLYNVGSGSYRHLAGAGLEVVRAASPDSSHHMTYELTDATVAPPSSGRMIAEVLLESLPQEPEKAGAWWAAIRRRITTIATESPGEYTVEVRVPGDVLPFVGLVKPALDGLVSALHVHDGSHEDHLRRALARYGDPATPLGTAQRAEHGDPRSPHSRAPTSRWHCVEPRR